MLLFSIEPAYFSASLDQDSGWPFVSCAALARGLAHELSSAFHNQ
jgi:hypothetical protein